MSNVKRSKPDWFNTFYLEEVEEYLENTINEYSEIKRRFQVWLKPISLRGMICILDKTYFSLNADYSLYLEMAFNVKDKNKMNEIVNAIKKWEKFSKNKERFICEFQRNETYIMYFHIGGGNSLTEYKRCFADFNPLITVF